MLTAASSAGWDATAPLLPAAYTCATPGILDSAFLAADAERVGFTCRELPACKEFPDGPLTFRNLIPRWRC